MADIIRRRPALLVLFALSGFTGLVYESTWTHYLKLLLGHAAYAQTLVLAIFMGGMAFGAWLTSRHAGRIRNPILAYALVELVIGVAAFLFHPLFELATGWYWAGSGAGMGWQEIAKWSIAISLILPQSVLLGTTFPLMSAGIARMEPGRAGRTLGLLYFSNSLGAAVGVLVGVFVLLPRFGLPGTLGVAGGLNLLLAACVLLLSAGLHGLPALAGNRVGVGSAGDHGKGRLLLLAALLTGLASFCYEVAWIRLLSLVLGTTMQAFELMLSAFIMGLALGGLWVRNRLDRLAEPLALAAAIQVLMALAALATLPGYGALYDVMAALLKGTARNAEGYLLFNFGSHLIALLLMLPATFLAGMTLPLFTAALLRLGQGERAIGRIYAANTLGAIAGVLLSVHLLMPVFGSRVVIGFGAFVDLLLGLLLMRAAWEGRLKLLPVFASLLAFGLLWPQTRIDPRRVASGVYRDGTARVDASVQVPFLADGKTATVAVLYDPGSRQMNISTNGKPEAALALEGAPAAPDEVTMGLLALLPLGLKPGPLRVANIGFGSGMTSDVLLASRRVESLDSVEIEPQVLLAARHFGARVQRVFTDPRSVLHVEDARTFFARSRARYDLVISEPSNPWVSGVASLFTAEFYEQVARRLEQDGLFVQWVNLYEFNIDLLASVVAALDTAFVDYRLFTATDSDLLIIAGRQRVPERLDGALLAEPAVRQELERLGFTHLEQLERNTLGDRADFAAWFTTFGAEANSDYQPRVALEAPAARFLREDAGMLLWLHNAPLPVIGRHPEVAAARAGSVAADGFVERGVAVARQAVAYMGNARMLPPSQQRLAHAVHQLRQAVAGCRRDADPGILVDDLYVLAAATTPYLHATELGAMWHALDQGLCRDESSVVDDWLGLLRGIALREPGAIEENARRLLAVAGAARGRDGYLVAAGAWAALRRGEGGRAWLDEFRKRMPPTARQPHYLRLLRAQLGDLDGQ